MRTTRTFILRLLLDSDDPTALRGALCSVDTSEERTFADAGRLLALLTAETTATALPEAAPNAQPATTAVTPKRSP